MNSIRAKPVADRKRLRCAPRRRIVISFLGVLIMASTKADAQPTRVEGSFAIDGGTLPDRLATRCAGAGSSTYGGGPQAALRVRPRGPLVLQVDTRLVLASFGRSGCVAEARRSSALRSSTADVEVEANRPPYAESLLRMGVETRGSGLHVRAMLGIGMTLSPDPSPAGALSLAVSGRNYFAEIERMAATFIPLYGAPGKVRPSWITVRIGAITPIGGPRTAR